MPPNARGEMETFFGSDFSRVRIHTGTEAARAAQEMHAHAFTLGDHIAFARGAYAPETSKGRALLAHELAHTIQQSSSASENRGGTVSSPSDPAEGEARAATEAWKAGRSFRPRQQGDGFIQRKCACDGGLAPTGECEDCSEKKRFGLQTKLKINKPGDIYEQQADRIADEVLATPARRALSGALPHIQRLSGQWKGQIDAVPASVDHTLASPGKPLEPVLRQDMEQRFKHDFSRVRVHSDARAEQSAREINAHAYTVGHNVVFGAGRWAPKTLEGRRLIAHELTHVAQQCAGARAIQRAPDAQFAGAGFVTALDDEELQRSVGLTADQARERLLDIEAAVALRRATSGGTDRETARLEDEARLLEQAIARAKPAGRHGAKRKKAQGQPEPLASRDLRNAPLDQIMAYFKDLRSRQRAGDDNELLQLELAQTEEMLEYATHTYDIPFAGEYGLRKHQAIKLIKDFHSLFTSDIQELKILIRERQRVDEEASSWAKGPVKFWAGGVKLLEISDLANMNVLRLQAMEAIKQEDIGKAISLMGQSVKEYQTVAQDYVDAENKIQKGGKPHNKDHRHCQSGRAQCAIHGKSGRGGCHGFCLHSRCQGGSQKLCPGKDHRRGF